jgi:hypothetical protein
MAIGYGSKAHPYVEFPFDRIIEIHWGGIGAVHFDGKTWITRGQIPTGLTDSGQFLFSGWLRPDDLSNFPFLLSVLPNSTLFGIAINTDGSIGNEAGRVQYEFSDGGAEFLNYTLTYNVPDTPALLKLDTAHYWHVLIAATTASAVATTQLAINGTYVGELAQDYASIVPNYDPGYPPIIDYLANRRKDADGVILAGPNTDFIGFAVDTAGHDAFTGDAAEIYFAPGQYLDISSLTNIAKFIDFDVVTNIGKPASLGGDGSLPTGRQPLIYFHVGAVSDDAGAAHFADNSGSGGRFAVTGLLTPAVHMPVSFP